MSLTVGRTHGKSPRSHDVLVDYANAGQMESNWQPELTG